MKSAEKIEKLIKKSRYKAGPEAYDKALGSFLQAVDAYEKQKSALSEPNIWRIIMKNPVTKIAAAAVILVALFLLFDSTPTLYARIMEVLEDTQTVHLVGESLIDGKPTTETEIWYDRDKGIVRTFWHEGQENSVLIDDGKYMWYYSKIDDLATRSKSRDSIEIIADLLEVSNFKSRADRDPDNDKIIDGIMCKAYVFSFARETRINRFWIDESKRVRIYEKARLGDDEQWHKISVCRVEYNIPVNPKVFVADFGPSAKKIHVDTLIEEKFNLNSAVFSKETDGLIFAVHKLAKCENNIAYMVCSIRPTEQVRKKARTYGLTTARMYGYFDWLPIWKAEQYYPMSLLEIYHDGLFVRWNLMVPRALLSEKTNEFEVGVHIRYEGRLANEREREDMPTEVIFDPITILPFEKQQLLLGKIIADTYSEYEVFQPLKALDLLWLSLGRFTKPTVTDEKDYAEQIMHRINKVRGNN